MWWLRGAFCIFTTRFHRKLLGNRAATNGTQHFAGKIISLDTKQESTRLTPIWPGFVYDATYELVLSQFVVRSPLCFKRFSSVYYGFPSPSKPTCPNSNSLGNFFSQLGTQVHQSVLQLFKSVTISKQLDKFNANNIFFNNAVATMQDEVLANCKSMLLQVTFLP